jgi:hypothetical protein
MTNTDFLSQLRAVIQQNDGRPPGEARFYKETGLTRSDLWAAGYDTYGGACKAAGVQPNTLQPRLHDDELFRPLAVLARKIGRFPPKGALEVERRRNSRFPSWEAFKRRERQGPETSLRAALAAWCRLSPEFSDIADLLAVDSPPAARRSKKRIVNGYVYLIRYGSGGSVYKIGRTEDVGRRHAQLNSMAPQDLRIIHSIPTDDPQGIERYWLERFADKRIEGQTELFRLGQDEIAAFKSRAYQ